MKGGRDDPDIGLCVHAEDPAVPSLPPVALAVGVPAAVEFPRGYGGERVRGLPDVRATPVTVPTKIVPVGPEACVRLELEKGNGADGEPVG